MTVKDLIKELQKYHPNTPVTHSRDDFPFDVGRVELIDAIRAGDDHWHESLYPEIDAESEPVTKVLVLRG